MYLGLNHRTYSGKLSFDLFDMSAKDEVFNLQNYSLRFDLFWLD